MVPRYLRLPVLAILLLGGLVAGGETERLQGVPAVQLDPALPDQPFGDWLGEVLPHGAIPSYGVEACSGRTGDCVIVVIDVVSRARTLRLEFDVANLAFLGGTLGAPDLERMPPIELLADVPKQLVAGIRSYPLNCPEGTRLQLREEYAGLIEWCEDGAGVKQGPARAWFSTGRYLMHRGSFVAGERAGRWVECNRFERCEVRTYQ